MKDRTFETSHQEDHSRIFTTFVIFENLSFESQTKSIIFHLKISNENFLSDIM